MDTLLRALAATGRRALLSGNSFGVVVSPRFLLIDGNVSRNVTYPSLFRFPKLPITEALP